jgi:EAL domain-containing protein (putative c-di-GMP-specific phosphodiesterase class I)
MSDPLSQAVLRRDVGIVGMVRSAIAQGRVMLAFQPVVLAGDHRQVAFYEGLIRVMDPMGRILPAADFILQVEELEIGRLLDCLALEEGLRCLSQIPDLRLSLNMSARSIGYPRWAACLARALRKDPTIAERLILEVSEASAIRVPELVARFIGDLRPAGISFALDDFGAGYTAFRHFRSFQFDIVKFDGQYSRNLAQNADHQVILRSMLAMARQLDMYTSAEQVEASEDAAYLSDVGVDCLQGFHFGAPTVHPPWKPSHPVRNRA